MAENGKKITSIEEADAFFDGVMKYKEKITKTEAGLETFEKSGKYKQYDETKMDALSALEELNEKTDVQKEMISENSDIKREYEARQKLLEQKEKYLNNVKSLEEGIKVAISKYIVDSEKEQKKLAKNRDNYAEFVKGEKAKFEALEAEIKALEGENLEENEDVIASKKEQLDLLKSQIESFDKRLASFDERIEKLDSELKKNKEKYKDYIELSKQTLDVPEVVDEGKENKTVEGKDEKAKENKEKQEDIEEKENKTEGDKTVEGESEKAKENKKEQEEIIYDVAAVQVDQAQEPATPKPSQRVEPRQAIVENDIHEASQEPKKVEETDEQAFNRISKLMIDKKSEITEKDMDKMIELLSDKENFSKFNLKTDRFLGIFKSKGEKIYTRIGRELDKNIRGSIKDNNLLSKLDSNEITKWKYINEIGNGNSYNNVLQIMDEAIEGSKGEDLEKLQTIKSRFEKFNASTKTLVQTRLERGEVYTVAEALPQPQPEASHEETKRGTIEGLEDMLKTDEEIAQTSQDKPAKEKSKEESTRDNII